MSAESIRLTVNDVEVRVPAWARWRDAVTAWKAPAGAALSSGGGYLADDSGAPLDADGHVVPGARVRFYRAGEGSGD